MSTLAWALEPAWNPDAVRAPRYTPPRETVCHIVTRKPPKLTKGAPGGKKWVPAGWNKGLGISRAERLARQAECMRNARASEKRKARRKA